MALDANGSRFCYTVCQRVATDAIQAVLHGNTGRVPHMEAQTFSDA